MKQLHTLGIVALFLAATLALTQQPQVTNTQFKSEPASSELSATVDRFLQLHGALWLGYAVPAVPGTHLCSCSGSTHPGQVEDRCSGEYQLEQDKNWSKGDAGRFSPANIYVLLRMDGGRITAVRAVSAECRLNAGGIPLQWLTSVQQDQSVALLNKLAEDRRDLTDQSLAALSMHATPKATQMLAGLAAAQDSELREKAAFWLGVQRGRDGFVILQRLFRDERDNKFREKLTFDLFVNSDPAVADELIRIAKSDPAPEVRGQAIFWLAQKAGNKAAGAVNEALEKDPEIRVKQQAVFALSQLPGGENVTQLLRVARTNANPAIRREAIFWLGQSKDPRALQFLEEILKR